MQHMVRASDLLDRNVRDAAGERAGSIDDVVVNMADGELRYAVIGFSQGWFRPDQLVAVPIEALTRSAQYPRDVIVTATRQQLENAPVFDKDRWPNFRDEQYQSAWNRFMDQFRGGATSPTMGTGTATGTGTTGTGVTGATGGQVVPGTGTTGTAPAPRTNPR
jgi:sporulation protein YlmC with PRC-barrel domain